MVITQDCSWIFVILSCFGCNSPDVPSDLLLLVTDISFFFLFSFFLLFQPGAKIRLDHIKGRVAYVQNEFVESF